MGLAQSMPRLMEIGWVYAVQDTGFGGWSKERTTVQGAVDLSQWSVGVSPLSLTVES
jgi:hypothetical protein